MLIHPPIEFKTVIENHFFLHRESVLKQCDVWAKLDGNRDITNQIVEKVNALHPPVIQKVQSSDDDFDSDEQDSISI